ncbi:MAG: hypothetical protein IT377_22425 [Polyangiaceae bacterium]|nr:hypothetical protein [Polyangiaceae bacterium]
MRRRRLPVHTPKGRLETLLSGLIGHELPDEPRATCSDCAMASPEVPEGDDAHFHPRLKCCTFIPLLPNFLVGEVLASKDAREGRKRLERRIAQRRGVSPLGVAPSRAERSAEGELDDASFGRAKGHVCPYLDAKDGRCSIWRQRNSVCTTWFCKHSRGAVSLRFWEAVKEALSVLERALAEHCVLILDAGKTLCLATLASESRGDRPTRAHRDDELDEHVHRKLWGAWGGREKELFVRSAQLVSALSPGDVLGLGGAPLSLALERVRRAREALVSPRPLAKLRSEPAATFQLVGSDALALSSYRLFDPLEAPKAILEVLPLFDGRPTAQVLRQVRRRTGLEIDAATLRELVDFEILREIE